ncbi:MAG: AzlD domain-containing protein [Pseudomonadota bacterium]|nr:AzlD domain-containing protein [Pseudomonadota bacterium]
MADPYLTIFLCALLTYGVRSGGHLLMTYFGAVHHRIEAGLNAVPIAVLSALVAPTVVTEGWPEALAIVLVCLLSLRFSMLPSLALAVFALAVMRQLAGA